MNGSPTNCACVAPGREDIQGLLCRSVDSLFALLAQTHDGPVLFGQQKVMSITLILDLDILTFFGLGDPGDFASSSRDRIEKPMFHLQ